MQALLIVIVTCHVSCVTVTACHTLAWVGEVPPSIDDLSELTCYSASALYVLCNAGAQAGYRAMLDPECREWCLVCGSSLWLTCV